ncbi:hypothetical protein [Hyphomonas sp. BRH_c22]|uniref:hypothetical protein n=1 Tax=Hyphomonas sp. BRH_c22 TaxID=1629710 RepID=UPI002634EF0D|nr:hypothetical protein [Hyphomonas sp. BRH_c22]
MTNFRNEDYCVTAEEILYMSADAVADAGGAMNYLEAAKYFAAIIGQTSATDPDAQARFILEAVRTTLRAGNVIPFAPRGAAF